MGKLAVTIPEAAELASVSDDIIRLAIRRGTLAASYPSKRPIIRVVELERWLEELPTEAEGAEPTAVLRAAHAPRRAS